MGTWGLRYTRDDATMAGASVSRRCMAAAATRSSRRPPKSAGAGVLGRHLQLARGGGDYDEHTAAEHSFHHGCLSGWELHTQHQPRLVISTAAGR